MPKGTTPPSLEFSGSITPKGAIAMDSDAASDAAQPGGATRFLPASLVFLLLHVLFVGGAIFLASMN
jgi:hypothetical protein